MTNLVRDIIHYLTLDFPIMQLSKTKCLILESNQQAIYFDETQGIKKQTSFRLDPTKTISNIVMQEMYVVVIYESSIAIYNSQTGDKLEERVTCDKQFKFRLSCINTNSTEVYVVTHNNSSGKNIIQSEVHQLMEIPVEDQIEQLLFEGRTQEAKELFLLKEHKGANFKNRLNEFNIDAGWVYMTKQLDFDNVLANFKQTDIDPREIVLLFKDLYETSAKLTVE